VVPSPVDLKTYEQVHAFVDTSDQFPPEVRDLLLQSLSDDPDDGPRLAEEFLDRAAAAVRPARNTPSCLLALQQTKIGRIGCEFGSSDQASTEAAVVEDPNAVCAIEPKASSAGEVGDAFGDLWLHGLTKAYHVRPDATLSDRLVVLSASSPPSGWLEQQRERSVTPHIDFRFAPRGRDADRLELSQVQQLVAQFLYDRAEAKRFLHRRPRLPDRVEPDVQAVGGVKQRIISPWSSALARPQQAGCCNGVPRGEVTLLLKSAMRPIVVLLVLEPCWCSTLKPPPSTSSAIRLKWVGSLRWPIEIVLDPTRARSDGVGRTGRSHPPRQPIPPPGGRRTARLRRRLHARRAERA
jgi:hypothetical protein